MAEQDGSAATSSTTPNFWDLHSISSWNNVLPWHPLNPNSNFTCEEEITISNSFTNTSNHSGLSNQSSSLDHHLNAPLPSTSNELTGVEPMPENHLWSQVLLNVGSTGDLHGNTYVGEDFLEALSSNMLVTTNMFEPACDYSNTASFRISNSFTNTSNHSGLSNQSSSLDHHLNAPLPSTSNELTSVEPMPENHLWSQVLLNVGSTGDLHGNTYVGEDFLEALSSNMLVTTNMFEPACDYSNTASFNNVEKQSNSSAFNGRLLEHEGQGINLSNLAGNWSTALPLPAMEANSHIKNINSIDHNNQFSESTDLSHDQMKLQQEYHTSNNSVGNMNGFFPCYGHQEIHHEQYSSEASNLRSFRSQLAAGDPNNKYYNESLDAPWSNSNSTNNLSDICPFNVRLLNNKPMVGIQNLNKQSFKASPPQINNKKHGHDSTSLPPIKGSGRGNGKKRCDDNSETVFKKPKQEPSSSTVPAVVKVQATEELRKRVASLHEIVSPFGKTDRASVLQKTIAYIKFLQEKVQKLSNPYMKANTNKDPLGALGLLLESSSNGKEKAGGEAEVFDLKCKGLCLLPVSCIPQVYREDTGGSDFWTTTCSESLYR